MDTTPNLALPYIAAAQAQKHVTHNEAIRALDALLHLTVVDRDLSTPPGTPSEGARYLVAAAPTGAWASHASKIAAYQDGAWMFYQPREGWRVWVADEDIAITFDGAAWITASGGTTTVNPTPLVGVNATADAQNRLSVTAPNALFNAETADIRLKLNKVGAAATASMLYQQGFSGRSEIGLTGDDNFHIKVSPNGSTWLEALVVDRTTGAVTLPNTPATSSVVKQIKSAKKTNGFTTTSSTPQATGLAVTLTPTSATTRCLVRAALTLGAHFWQTTARVTVRRNGTQVWPSTAGLAMNHQYLSADETNSNLISFSAAIEFEDTPGITTPVTYEVFLASSSGAHNAHLNLRNHDLTVRGESNLTVTEFAA